MAEPFKTTVAGKGGRVTSVSIKGADVDKSFETGADQDDKAREAEYAKTLPAQATGMGGAAWRAGAAGKAHRAAWDAAHPKKTKMTPPPSPEPPKLTDIEKP